MKPDRKPKINLSQLVQRFENTPVAAEIEVLNEAQYDEQEVLQVMGRAMHSTDVQRSLEISSAQDIEGMVEQATSQAGVVQSVIKKYRIDDYIDRLKAFEGKASQSDFDQISAHIAAGGTLDDKQIAPNPALPVVHLANQYNVVRATADLAQELDTMSSKEVPEHLPFGRTRGVARTGFKAVTATTGTVFTAKGLYAAGVALSGKVGLSISGSVLYWGAMGVSAGVTGGIIYGGYLVGKEGGVKKAAKKYPVRMGIVAACAATSALFATAGILKAISTAERASTYGKGVLGDINSFVEFIRKGSPAIKDVQNQAQQIKERRIKIVEAEVDPARRGAGVGDTKTGSGYGPVATGLDFLLSGTARPTGSTPAKQLKKEEKKAKEGPKQVCKTVGKGKGRKKVCELAPPEKSPPQATTPRAVPSSTSMEKAREVRSKYSMTDGVPVEERYIQILDAFVQNERADALKALTEYVNFLTAVDEKQPSAYAWESVDPRPSKVDPLLIKEKLQPVLQKIQALAAKYNEGAKTVGKKFLDDFMKDGLDALGVAQAGIEIPRATIKINTDALENIKDFSTAILPFPDEKEWPAILGYLNKYPITSWMPYLSEYGIYSLFMLVYLLWDNGPAMLQGRYERVRRKKESERLPEHLRQLHKDEADLADRIALYINKVLLPYETARAGGQPAHIVEVDFIRYRLRQLAYEENKSDGAGMLVHDSILGAGRILGQFMWGAPLPNTEHFNTYHEFVKKLRQDIDGDPIAFSGLIERVVPQAGNVLRDSINSITGKPGVLAQTVDTLRGTIGTITGKKAKTEALNSKDLVRRSLNATRAYAGFLNMRLNRTQKLVANMSQNIPAELNVPAVYEGAERVLDGTGTVFIDSSELRYFHALQALKLQYAEDLVEMRSLGNISSRLIKDLNLLAISEGTKDEVIRLASGQFPEFILGWEKPKVPGEPELLTKEQAVDSALANRVANLLENQIGDNKKFSENLRFIDAHALSEIRKRIAQNPVYAQKDLVTTMRYTVDKKDGFGGFAITLRLIDKKTGAPAGEITTQFDVNATAEDLNAFLLNWFSGAELELEARALTADSDQSHRSTMEKLFTTKELDVNALPPFNLSTNEVTPERFKSLINVLALKQMSERQRSMLEDDSEPIDNEDIELFRQSLDSVVVPGFENDARKDARLTLFKELYTLRNEFDSEYNIDTGVLVLTKKKPGGFFRIKDSTPEVTYEIPLSSVQTIDQLRAFIQRMDSKALR